MLDDMIAGRKTIEGRLNRDKFARYQVGDIVCARRDIRGDDGVLRKGEIDGSEFEIMAIRKYSSFLEMIQVEGWHRVIPDAGSAEAAADVYDRYYTANDQIKYGVLAIEIQLVA